MSLLDIVQKQYPDNDFSKFKLVKSFGVLHLYVNQGNGKHYGINSQTLQWKEVTGTEVAKYIK